MISKGALPRYVVVPSKDGEQSGVLDMLNQCVAGFVKRFNGGKARIYYPADVTMEEIKADVKLIDERSN